MVAEGDLVTVVWTARGTNSEERGITVWRIVDGKIRAEMDTHKLGLRRCGPCLAGHPIRSEAGALEAFSPAAPCCMQEGYTGMQRFLRS
jgi:hypothetical protein